MNRFVIPATLAARLACLTACTTAQLSLCELFASLEPTNGVEPLTC